MSDAEELMRLADLHQRGALSDEEFRQAKARVLNDAPASGTDALHEFRRSRSDRWLGGVCGGLGRVTGVPSWVWRLLLTLLLIFAGVGALLYVLLWIFVPEAPASAGDSRAAQA